MTSWQNRESEGGAAAEGRRPPFGGRPEAAPLFCQEGIKMVLKWYLNGLGSSCQHAKTILTPFLYDFISLLGHILWTPRKPFLDHF